MADLADIVNQPVVKRSINIAGHATSISLEEPFWAALKKLATQQQKTLPKLIAEIDEARSVNLSSALRLYVLNQLNA
ncbi:MAG: ribbon-helix-helix domain-containing protein [Pseudomonadota bacterium]